jgi:hypothetical protein
MIKWTSAFLGRLHLLQLHAHVFLAGELFEMPWRVVGQFLNQPRSPICSLFGLNLYLLAALLDSSFRMRLSRTPPLIAAGRRALKNICSLRLCGQQNPLHSIEGRSLWRQASDSDRAVLKDRTSHQVGSLLRRSCGQIVDSHVC